MTETTVSNAALARRTILTGAAALAFGGAVSAAPRGGGPKIDEFVVDQMRRARIPGLALGLAEGGETRWARGYGFADLGGRRPVTTQTVFPIASVTKTVTATAIMQLADQGRLRLDEPVQPYLDFPLANPEHLATAITFRHLLTHVSSISDGTFYRIDFRERGRDAALSLDDLVRGYLAPDGRLRDATCFSKAAPGEAYDYSNVGYSLLGYVGGRIAGEDLRRRIDREIFARLGAGPISWTTNAAPAALRTKNYDMTDAGPAPVEPLSFPDWPAGMIRSSIAAFMPFVAASANGGAARGRRILSESGMAQMLDMRAPTGLPAWLTGQGLGWMASPLDGATRPNHWGGDDGVFTAVYLDPSKRRGVGVFTNMTATAESKAAVKAIAGRLLSGAAS